MLSPTQASRATPEELFGLYQARNIALRTLPFSLVPLAVLAGALLGTVAAYASLGQFTLVFFILAFVLGGILLLLASLVREFGKLQKALRRNGAAWSLKRELARNPLLREAAARVRRECAAGLGKSIA